jgi:hypothetical protein
VKVQCASGRYFEEEWVAGELKDKPAAARLERQSADSAGGGDPIVERLIILSMAHTRPHIDCASKIVEASGFERKETRGLEMFDIFRELVKRWRGEQRH